MQKAVPELIPHEVLEDGSIKFKTWDDAIFYVESCLQSQNFKMTRLETNETVVTRL